VDCVEIRQAFIAGGVPSGPSVDEHLRACAHCNELFGNGAELGQRLAGVASCAHHSESEQLRISESLIAGERGVHAFLRSRSTRLRWALSLSLPAMLLAFELSRARVSMRELGSARTFLALLLLGLLGFIARSALRPLPIERRTARLLTLFALVAWCAPCALWLVAEGGLSARSFSGRSFAVSSLGCFGNGSALAAPSFVLLCALQRAERIPYRVWTLAAGLVAVLANLILVLRCANTALAHLIAGHFSIGLFWFLAVSIAIWWRSWASSR
jgi:hypothetical protein